MSSLKEVVATVARILPYLDLETQQRILAVIQEFKPKFAAMEAGGLPAVDEMAKAVPDDLVRAIVNDNRGGPSQPGWLPPPKSAPVERGSGWQDPPKAQDRIALVLVVLVQDKWTSQDSWFAAVFASAVMAMVIGHYVNQIN